MTPCATEEIPEEETKNTKANSINWLFKTPVSPTSSQRDQTSSMMNTGIILKLIISLCFAFELPNILAGSPLGLRGLPQASQGHWLLILRGHSGKAGMDGYGRWRTWEQSGLRVFGMGGLGMGERGRLRC